ncbi:MAG TPA: phosphoribosylaminoimidazolesuccinocarboxamide synthase, partial [Coriobacteriia bacterium]
MTDTLGLRPDSQGKVRDIYDLGDRLLLVASDRLSAFDVVLSDPIPHKGEVLTKLSLYWFELLGGIVDNHLLSADVADLPDAFKPHADYLAGRFMLVRKANVFPVECIVRGYLAGSGWAEYARSGTVCGTPLPSGLVESARLPQPMFTPSTKAELGTHDENISVHRMFDMVGEEHGAQLQEASVAVYSAARDHAAEKGVIIADTKFEFGLIDGTVTL